MHSVHELRARAVAGLLDPECDQSYYVLLPCPRHGMEARLEDHRACDHYAGTSPDEATGAHLIYCRNPETTHSQQNGGGGGN